MLWTSLDPFQLIPTPSDHFWPEVCSADCFMILSCRITLPLPCCHQDSRPWDTLEILSIQFSFLSSLAHQCIRTSEDESQNHFSIGHLGSLQGHKITGPVWTRESFCWTLYMRFWTLNSLNKNSCAHSFHFKCSLSINATLYIAEKQVEIWFPLHSWQFRSCLQLVLHLKSVVSQP